MSGIIVALDGMTGKEAVDLVDMFIARGIKTKFKVGSELFTREGPSLLSRICTRADVFLDLKFYDIPNTMERSALSAVDLGVWMFNVHAAAGPVALRAVRNAVDERSNFKKRLPLVTAVTLLTSLDQAYLDVFMGGMIKDQYVDGLVGMAESIGMDAIVCAAEDLVALRKAGRKILTVVPGIRPAGVDDHDQKRVSTPEVAVKLGADFLVIGRAITNASDPIVAYMDIEESMDFPT